MNESFEDFTRRVPNFSALSPTDQICHAAWYLHSIKNVQLVTTTAINSLFNEIHAVPPHTAVYLKRLADRKPPLMIKNKAGYRLESTPRRGLEEKFGQKPDTAALSSLLSGLLDKIGQGHEGRFLEETLRCYSVRAFRAAIVMAWNLAFDHLIRWILADTNRLSAFNTSAQTKYSKKFVPIQKLDDFADYKEFEVIESCQHSKIIAKNVCEILKEKLKRRNAAAHPSSVVITQAQADDVITDLVNNVVLTLS